MNQRCTSVSYASGVLRWELCRAICRIGWLSVVGILVAAVSAGASSDNTLLRNATEATFAAHSAEVEFAMSLSAPGQGSYTALELRGQEQFSAPTKAVFEVSVPTASGKTSRHFQELLDGTTLYMNPLGRWYSETSQQALATEGLSGSLANSSNPTDVLGFLDQQGATVKKLGRALLDGSETTEYRSIVNLNKAAAAGTPNGIAMTPQYLHRFKRLTGKSSLTAEVWIDGAGVVRQERVTYPLSRSGLAAFGLKGAPSGIKVTMTVAFSNFGTPVVVTPPATSQPLPTTSGLGTGRSA